MANTTDAKSGVEAVEALANDIKKDAEAAEAIFQEEQEKPDAGTYKHKFAAPFTWKQYEWKELEFDWTSLTGGDFCDIEAEYLRSTGRTLVSPEFTSMFLASMAARACTLRDDGGRPIVTTITIRAMPLRDFRAVTRAARGFLMRAV